MPIGHIEITSRPAGDAPAEIRDKWIGAVLPVHHRNTGPVANVIGGEKINMTSGYVVIWADAMHALGSRHPEARRWWEQNVASALVPVLIFDEDCCKVVPD